MYTIFLAFPNHTPDLFSGFKKFNSFQTSRNFCHLLITFANSFNPDQDRQNVGPDLDPNRLTLWTTLMVFLKEFITLLTFANSLNPDQDRQNVIPDLDLNGLTLWWYSKRNFLKNLHFEKNQQTTESMQNYPVHILQTVRYIKTPIYGYPVKNRQKNENEEIAGGGETGYFFRLLLASAEFFLYFQKILSGILSVWNGFANF